jgi:hypothetical protein
MSKYSLDDGFKADALKLLEAPAMKALIEVLRARVPEYAGSDSDMHTIAAQAKMREGYELAVANLLQIPHENPEKPPVDPDQVLLDPRD